MLFLDHIHSCCILARVWRTAMASHSIPLPILDDLGSRFIINIPDEERKDIIRIMFQVREDS